MEARSDAREFVFGSFGLDIQEYEPKLTAPGNPGPAPSASGASGEGGTEGAAGGTGSGESALGPEILTTRSNDASGRTGPSQGREPVQSDPVGAPSEEAPVSGADRRTNMIHALAAARRNVAKINEGRNDGDKRFDKINICGRPHDKNARIEYSKDIRTGAITGVWARGLLECELAWLCPQCGAREGWRQEQMIRDAIVGYQTLGPEYEAMFMTLTATHAWWRSLEDMLGAVVKGFTELVTNSRLWKGLRKDGTIYGWIRALEITYSTKEGSTGWHPHVHVLVFVKDRAAFMEAWNRKGTGIPYEWNRVLNKVTAHLEHPDEPGKKRPIGCHPDVQHVRLANLDDVAVIANYVTKGRSKWDIAKEVARGDLKTAAKTSMTPQEMLLRSGCNDRMAKLWREYALATSGVHAITHSRMRIRQTVRVDVKAERKSEPDYSLVTSADEYVAMTKARIQRAVLEGPQKTEEITKRVHVGEYLAEIGRKHRIEEESRQKNLAAAKAERDFEAQQESWDALSEDQQAELIARDEQVAAAELDAIPAIGTALRVDPALFKEWKATSSFPEQIRRLQEIIRAEGMDAGMDYVREEGLPFTDSQRLDGTTARGAQLRELRAERAEFEERHRARLREELYGFRDGDADLIERRIEELSRRSSEKDKRTVRARVEEMCATYAGSSDEFIEERVEDLLQKKLAQFDGKMPAVSDRQMARFRTQHAWGLYRSSLTRRGLALDDVEDEMAAFSKEYDQLLNEEKLPRHEVEDRMRSWVEEQTGRKVARVPAPEPAPTRVRNDGGASAAPRTRARRSRRSRMSTIADEIYEEY